MESMNLTNFIANLSVQLPGFLLAIVFHEAAHALMAYRFGDPTAKLQGRLSLNPAVHFSLFGTVIFPLICAMFGGVIFGWANPVPVDTRNFKNVRKGIFWTSFAGPGANIILAILSAFSLAFLITQVPPTFSYFVTLKDMFYFSMQINCILAVFNLIPFPPLDGSKMVSTFLSYENARKYEDLQKYGFLFILVLWTTNILSYLLIPAQVIAGSFLRLFSYLLA